MSKAKRPGLPKATEQYDSVRRRFVRGAACPEHGNLTVRMVGSDRRGWLFNCARGPHVFIAEPAEPSIDRARVLAGFGRDLRGRLRE